MITKKLSPGEKAKLSPTEYRLMVRRGEWPMDDTEILGYCEGYTRHAIVILPKDYAFEFLTFCVRNPRALYVADICEPGLPHPMLLAPGADVRTDCNGYRVYKNGEVIDEPADVMNYWRDDLVSFFPPCGFTLLSVMRGYKIKFRYMGVYYTNVQALPAGRFSSHNMITVAIACETKHDAIRAIEVSSRLPVGHGSPVHIGDPADIGIKNILKPDFGKPSTEPPKPGEVMLYWLGGLTSESAIRAAKPPLAIMHRPPWVFLSDRLAEEFAYTEEIGSPITGI